MKTPFRIEYSTDCWPSPDAEDIANRTILGIVDADGTPVARNHDLFEFDAEACRRIVASVNVLSDLDVEQIEAIAPCTVNQRIRQVTERNVELVTALGELIDAIDDGELSGELLNRMDKVLGRGE